jgi:hypothetical protein
MLALHRPFDAVFLFEDSRHDSGNSARPYIDGALLAIRKVSGLVGLHRGLDAVLEI